MLFVMMFLVSRDVQAHKLIDKIYEKETAVSLGCKQSAHWSGMSNVSCADIATTETIYTFGFVVEEDACMVCRAGGTPGVADVLEISMPSPLYVQGEISSRKPGLLRQIHFKFKVIWQVFSNMASDWLAACCQTIKDHVWKCLLTNMDLNLEIC